MIARSKSSQKAGEHAQQLQVAGDLVVIQGITEADARDIATQVAQAQLAEFAATAEDEAKKRVATFDSILVDQISAGGALGVFGDPSFQILLRKAQLAAAATGRESDYDLLARLIEERIARGDQRQLKAGIDRAVQVVDQIDEQALTAITAAYCLTRLTPVPNALSRGLDAMDTVFGQILQSGLPEGQDWLDHLDILDAVRLSSLVTVKKFDEYYLSRMPGTVSQGIEAESEAETRLLRELAEANIHIPLIPHALKPGFNRLPFHSSADATNFVNENPGGNATQLAALLDIAKEQLQIDKIDPELVPEFRKYIDARPNLAKLAAWWDRMPLGWEFTSVGRALGRANAQRCDTLNLIPAFE